MDFLSRQKLHDRLLTTAWLITTLFLIVLMVVPIDIGSQILGSYSILLIMLGVRNQKMREIFRIFFLLLAIYLTLRYLYWRTTTTLSYSNFAGFSAAILLYLAEIYGITIYFLGIFVNVRPLNRQPVPLPSDEDKLPTVDIMIPSYNEPLKMLEVTLIAALQVRYPKHKLRVCLLDDGGTVQKCNDPDPVKSAEARERNKKLRALCERLGASYYTRERNESAKAGNINAALDHTHGDLILILDADHVPTVDFLENTVGLFIRDEKMFLVQTPHFFISPDPIEKNLQIFQSMPSENEMFYSVIQPGLDFWQSSFFCGSAALIRRSHLVEVGGISGDSITEDAETALGLHARGYHSAYINRPMVSGLQPETYTGFIVQRVRWAQGMVQIFLLQNPMLQKGLRPWQKLGYLSSTFYWFFAYARITYLLAPAAYLVFGLHIYDATMLEFFGYALPHIIAAMMVSNYLFGKVRWAFISELYEIMQSFFALPGIIKVFRNPRSPTFMVTPKGEQLENDFISKLSAPFYAVYIITLVALAFGIYRFIYIPEERDITTITMSWEILNLIILNAAIGALLERRQRRSSHRMPADLDAQLFFRGHQAIPCRITDLSIGGAMLIVDKGAFTPVWEMENAELIAYNHATNKHMRPRITVCMKREIDNNRVAVGIAFAKMPQSSIADMISFVHGDSERWLRFQEARKIQLTVWQAFKVMLHLGNKYAGDHFILIFESAMRFFKAVVMLITSAVFRLVARFRNWLLACD